MAEMLKKFTPKTIMGEKITAPKEATKVYTIYGVADSVKKGETAYGPWVGLVGRFEAVRHHDGVLMASTVAFIPEPMHSMIVNSLSQPDAQAVKFALDVIVKPRPDLAVGYEYIAAPIVDSTENDPLSDLRGTVKLALEAPADGKKSAKK